MVRRKADRIDEWWNRRSIEGFEEASLGRDEPQRILSGRSSEKASALRLETELTRAVRGLKGLR
jgi:hypothetical protein